MCDFIHYEQDKNYRLKKRVREPETELEKVLEKPIMAKA